MIIEDIVEYWRDQSRTSSGQWINRADQLEFERNVHSFNLNYPICPFVGDILNAPVIILGANAGYSEVRTGTEFPDQEAIDRYLARVADPIGADWSTVHPYYREVNYGELIAAGEAALINACAYRSRKISEEPQNRRLLEKLPSVHHTRRWLLEAVLPLAAQGNRLVVAKRAGLWKLPQSAKASEGIVFDPAPVSPQITSTAWVAVLEYLRGSRANRRRARPRISSRDYGSNTSSGTTTSP